jgi:hypothetical protein
MVVSSYVLWSRTHSYLILDLSDEWSHILTILLSPYHDFLYIYLHSPLTLIQSRLCTLSSNNTPWRTDTANQRGGGEWMGADKNSSRRRWKLQQDERGFQHTSPTHYQGWSSPRSHWSATGPRNQHATIRPEKRSGKTKPRVYRPTPVRPVSTTGQTGPCWWNWATFTKWLYTGQTGETHRSDRWQPESPQVTKQANRPPNGPKLETAAPRDNSELTKTFTRAKSHKGLHRSDRSRAPVRPV